MAIKDFFHPIFRKSLEIEDNEDNKYNLHDTIVDTLQAPLDKAKEDELNAKIDMYLDTSRNQYLDRFGSWFGLYRKKDWTDDYYRDRIKKHVLHERNTINGIRMALANFLETEIGNIHIYEPYKDMFIWNKSYWNTQAFYTSPYYRYAVIDIKIDAPIKPEIVDIINLFRPAGVLWVLTNDINGGLDAPIIELLSPKSVLVSETDTNYIGFNTRKALEINPGLDSANSPITNPFIYNDSDSLWNAGKVYYDIVHQNQNFTYLGQMFWNFTPLDTDNFDDSRSYAEQYVTNQYTSNIKGEGQTFSLSPEQNNLVTSGASGLIKGSLNCNLQDNSIKGNYQVGIRLQSNTSQNDIVKITFNGTNPVTQTITADSGKDYHYYNTQVSLPDNFESDGTVTLNATNSNFKYFSIKKATPAPMYYSLAKDDTRKVTGLASAIDVQRYLMAYDNTDLTSDFSKLDNIFDYFYINLSLYSNVVNEATLMVYNFQLGLWVNFDTHDITRGWNYLIVKLGAISPYMNNEGIVFYKALFKNQNTVRVNYFGLDFGYVNDTIDSAVASSGLGASVYSEGYIPRVDPTADGAHLYLDYQTDHIEK